MAKYKISFLIAAHNEEKLIGKALERLVQVHKDYPKIEVLIGLDGCTDRTLEICNGFAKKNKFFKIFELNERKGKQAVLEKLEPHITGDIVIIHDADWTFVYNSKQDLIEFLSLFDNENVGGIADSISSEFSKPNFWQIKSLGFIASTWGNVLLMKYYKRFTRKKNGLIVYDKDKMKFCPWLDIYRKKALDKTQHKKELRAGDHIERTLRLFNAGYDILSYDNVNWPHFNVSYNEESVKDLINQKVRGLISKSKIEGSYNFHISFLEFKLPFMLYVIGQSFKMKRFRDFFAIYVYLFVMVYSSILAKFKEQESVGSVWKLRVKR